MIDLDYLQEYDSGYVINVLDYPEAAYVHKNNDEHHVKLIHEARTSDLTTPSGTVIFHERKGARDKFSRAKLWAALNDRVPLNDPLEFRLNINDDCRRACVPAVVAGNGTAVTAVYLAAHGFRNLEIAESLDVGKRTISQYVADFKSGTR